MLKMVQDYIFDVDRVTIGNKLKDDTDIFSIPHYQRRYSWKRDHWKDFWKDVLVLESSDKHYLGSLVVITGQHSPTGLDELEVVDGQQRLTCFSILLSALRDYFAEEGKERRVDSAEECLFNKNLDGERIAKKIMLGSLDSDDYNNLIESNLENVEEGKIKKCYDFFREKIRGLNDLSDVKDLHSKLVKNVIGVIVTVSKERDAYRLFETLNYRGLELSPVDLIKNHLLRVSDERKRVNLNEIKNQWGEIITNLDNIRQIRFFRHYMMSARTPQVREKVTKNELYDKFRVNLQDVENRRLGIEGYVNDIKEKSELYSKICASNIDIFSPDSANDRINSHLGNLADIGAVPSYTLFLRAFDELDDRDSMIEILRLIENFSVRRIIGRFPTGELDDIYNHLAVNAFGEDDSVGYIREFLRRSELTPSDNEFYDRFKESNFRNNSQTKYILGELELKHYRDLIAPQHRSSYDVHIEHIAPKGTFYARSRKYDAWKEYLACDEEEFEEYKNRIGNLTSFERKLHIRATGNPFNQKKEYYRKSDFLMANTVSEYEEWGLEEIEERSQELAEIATEIWNLA